MYLYLFLNQNNQYCRAEITFFLWTRKLMITDVSVQSAGTSFQNELMKFLLTKANASVYRDVFTHHHFLDFKWNGKGRSLEPHC